MQNSRAMTGFLTRFTLAAAITLALVPEARAQAEKPNEPKKTPQQLQIEKILEPVAEHLQKSEWDKALKLADQALKVDPASGEAFVVKGKVLNGKGDYKAAITEFEKVTGTTARDPRSVANRADAFAERSHSLYQQGEFLKAIDSAYLSILEQGNHTVAWFNRGKAYLARRQLDKAINAFNRVIQLDAKHAEAYSLRGLAYGYKNNSNQLLADQKKALEIDPKLAAAYDRTASAKMLKGQLLEAYADVTKALELKPDFPDALCSRAALYALKGDMTTALDDLDKVLKLDPRCARAHLMRGFIYEKQKKPEDALASLDEAIRVNDYLVEAYVLRAQIRQQKKLLEPALEDLSHAIKIDPRLLAAYSARSDVYRKLGKTEEAKQDSLKVKELTPAPELKGKAKQAQDIARKREDERKKAEPAENRFMVVSKGVDAKKLNAALASAKKIDQFVAASYAKHKIKPNAKTTDSEFVRRIYLDITGTIPTLQQTQKFLSAKEPDKRSRLIDELLASDAYASHWFNYWADVLRYTDNLTFDVRGESYRQWIKQSLAENKPWNKMVHEMLTAEGLVWTNPATGYFQRDANMPLDNMNNTVRIFLGTRIGCAQCHDHPFDRWKQKEFYQMAAFTYGTRSAAGGGDKRYWGENPNSRLQNEFYALDQEEEDRRNTYYRFTRVVAQNQRIVNDLPNLKLTLPANYAYDDLKPGSVIAPKTLFGSATVVKPGEPPRKAFARWLTEKDNPRFALTIANRLWKQAFGIGQIEPVDDMMDDTTAENPALMAFLTEEMKRLDFDMKEYLRILYNTEVYQRQACTEDIGPGMPYHFPGPILRRMSAEQVWDSFLTLAVTDPYEFREQIADVRNKALSVDLNNVSAEDVVMAEEMSRKVDGGRYAREKKYMYKGTLLARASELPSPVPPSHFLRMFGQSDRELISASSTQGSVPQVLFMFNGPITHMMLEKNSTMYNNVARKSSIPEGVKACFLTILSREPDAEELEACVAEVTANGPAGYGNVIWSLVNTREFLFIQ